MFSYLQLHDICTWYDAVNVHDIVYVYANVAEYVYDIVCVYVDVYVFGFIVYVAYDEIWQLMAEYFLSAWWAI